VVRATNQCQPCYQRDCPLGTHQCMKDISVDDVFSAAVSLFGPAEIEAERVL
jgi:ADP-heptose:LPS heptosyltransferase